MMDLPRPVPMEETTPTPVPLLRSDQLPLRSVLVVDDERIVRPTLELQLAPLCCRLLLASSCRRHWNRRSDRYCHR